MRIRETTDQRCRNGDRSQEHQGSQWATERSTPCPTFAETIPGASIHERQMNDVCADAAHGQGENRAEERELRVDLVVLVDSGRGASSRRGDAAWLHGLRGQPIPGTDAGADAVSLGGLIAGFGSELGRHGLGHDRHRPAPCHPYRFG